MIKIGKLEMVRRPGNMVRLQAVVDIDDIRDIAFMDCDAEYEKYLVTEVSDAFVWTAIRYAMLHHHDIECETPVSSVFLHNVQYYCQSLMVGDSRLTRPEIISDVIDFSTHGDAVGCPVSCGVDSLYSIKKYINSDLPGFRLTHFFLTTQGLFGQYHDPGASRKVIFSRGQSLAAEAGLGFVGTMTNPRCFPQNFALAHTHTTLFSVLSLRKMFAVFFYPSGHAISDFSIRKSSSIDVANFDLLMSLALTLPGFRVYSSGGEATRLDKVTFISDDEMARKNLSVCIRDGHKNCNLCMKCKRTLLELDAIGSLDDFSAVFDVAYYKKNRHLYFRYLIENAEDVFMNPLMSYFSIRYPEAVSRAKRLSRFQGAKKAPSTRDAASVSAHAVVAYPER